LGRVELGARRSDGEGRKVKERRKSLRGSHVLSVTGRGRRVQAASRGRLGVWEYFQFLASFAQVC
jgi:hypothetical protein